MHRNSLREAVWSRKNPGSNRVILMLFEHGFYLTKPIWALICLHELYRKELRPWALDWSFRRCFCLRKHCVCLWCCGDNMTLTPFCLKKSCLRRGYFNVWATFSVRFRLKLGKIRKNNNHTCLRRCGLGWNQVKYARIMITHVCFIALRLAGSLGRCLNTRPNDLVSKQLPWDILMHEKTCVIPIFYRSL